jgi:hypothetical protein
MAVVNPTPLATRYLFDANAFVDLGERYYPDDIFGCLWGLMLPALGSGLAVTSKMVLGELSKAPVVQPWRLTVQAACKAQALDEADADIQAEFKKLAGAAIPKKVGTVDRWILSAASARKLPLVTRDGPLTAICGVLSVRPLDPTGFFREVGWTFP